MKKLLVFISGFLLIPSILFAACDAQTVLMLHKNGSDASTTFTDSSSGAKTVTAVGNAQIDTAQSKFGGASGLFDGTGDYLTVPDSADWDFGTGDFTEDVWLRWTSISNSTIISIISIGVIGSTGLCVVLLNSNTIRLYAGATTYDFAWVPSLNTWYHLAIARAGTELEVFVDGTQIGITQTSSNDIQSASATIWIGIDNSQTYGYFTGWMDELRISKGVARWTANFTPPTSEYCTDRRIVISN